MTPTKSGGQNGSISSFDAAKIAQFVVGAASLDPAQQIVADVSGNGNISSFDAALVATWAVGNPGTGLTGNWKFNPPSNTHASITGDITGEDYAALLMGDVSGNWLNNGARSALRSGPERNTAVAAPHLMTPANSEVLIPIRVDGAANKEIISYEFDLRYDPAVIQPRPNPVDIVGTVSRGLSVVANAKETGLLRVAVYGPMPLSGNGLLLGLHFTAVGSPGSLSPLTWERLVFNDGEPGATLTDGQVELSAAAPNKAEITGNLLNQASQGISNTRVRLTDTGGRSYYTFSNGSGIYRFNGLKVGQTLRLALIREKLRSNL